MPSPHAPKHVSKSAQRFSNTDVRQKKSLGQIPDSVRSEFALELRARLVEEARVMGIDEAFIAKVVDTFYDRVRAHPRLGPIFEGAIRGDWTPHLTKMKAFWGGILLHTGAYSGRPMAVHFALSDLESAHFGEWLALFEQTLRDLAPTEAAVDYFMEKATRIGQSMKEALKYRP
jgi:hemoglobin